MSQQYSRAPITEAVIDFVVELPEGSTLEKLHEFTDLQLPTYPVVKEIAHFNLNIMQLEAPKRVAVGYLASNDESK